MDIRIAGNEHLDILSKYDRHIARTELKNSLMLGRVYIAEEDGKIIGWLRYSLFWDNTPFMNMLYFLENHRQKGHGRAMVDYWEKQMLALGYRCVMTSTASDEYAQHFYVKSGYRAVGGFNYQNDPYEIIFMKDL